MKTKIALFQYDLGAGGIQRSLINLVKNIDPLRFDVDLYLFCKDNPLIEEIPDYVNVIVISTHNKLSRFLPFNVYRWLVRPKKTGRYDISVDFNGHQNITATYALSVRAKRYIYWVHSDHYLWKKSKHKNLLKQMYAQVTLSKSKWVKFDEFVGVSSGILVKFKQDYPNKKFWTIPNLIDTAKIFKQLGEPIDTGIDKNKLNIITVGRLEYEKGLDLFMPQLKEAIKQRDSIHFYIIGEGSDRGNLERQVKNLGISDNVTFLGLQYNPFKYMKYMDVFILNSRYEGQGMVLREAESIGLQILFPTRLEKYNDGLRGSDNIVEDLINLRRKPHHLNDLSDYNNDIVSTLNLLLSEPSEE